MERDITKHTDLEVLKEFRRRFSDSSLEYIEIRPLVEKLPDYLIKEILKDKKEARKRERLSNGKEN